MQADIIAEAISGSETASRDLFELWYPKAYRIAKSVCGNRAAAEDAVQEALIRLWRVLPRLHDLETADSYFYRTVANEARRVRAKLGIVSDEYQIGSEDEAVVSEEDQETAAVLAKAVTCLPEKLRSAVRLHYYGGFTEAETAEILGVSLSSVKMRLLRGRQRLKTALVHLGYEVTGG